jgi:chromosome segregation ATPase
VRFSYFNFSHFLSHFQLACTCALFVFVLIVCFDAGPSYTMATATPTADEELQKANKKLASAESELSVAKAELKSAQAATPSVPERITEAKLGVAKAELGVAKAELGVAEAKWESAGEGDRKVQLQELMNEEKENLRVVRGNVRLAQMSYEQFFVSQQGERPFIVMPN